MEQNFSYNNLPVRAMTDGNNETWFAGIDVCNILEYSDSDVAIKKLDEDERKLNRVRLGSGQLRKTWTVNEFGLYSLILTSTKPEAKAFKRWITHEVIPSIRKAGKYSTEAVQQKEARIQELIKMIDAKKIAVTKSKSEFKELESDLKNFEAELMDLIKSDPNQLMLFSNEEMKGK